MNRFKINFAAMAVILGLSAAFAFKSDAKKVSHKPFATAWFTYSGSGSPTAPANYNFAGDEPDDCNGQTTVCAIQAPVDANQKPQINTALSSEINGAAASHTPSANVSLRD